MKESVKKVKKNERKNPLKAKKKSTTSLPKRPQYLIYDLYPLDKPHQAILCLDCGWIRASWSGHDYRVCPCPNAAMVDGGFNYTRYGAMKLDRIQLLNLVPEGFTVKPKKQAKVVKPTLG